MANHRNFTSWDEFVQEITGEENESARSAQDPKQQLSSKKPQTFWDLSVPEDESLSVFLAKLQASAPFEDDDTGENSKVSRPNSASQFQDSVLNADLPNNGKITSPRLNPAANAKEEHPTAPKLGAVAAGPRNELKKILSEIDSGQKRIGKNKRPTIATNDDYSFHPPHLSTTPSNTDMPLVEGANSEVSMELSRITLTSSPLPKGEVPHVDDTIDVSKVQTVCVEPMDNKPVLPPLPKHSPKQSVPPPLPSAKMRQSMVQAQTIQANTRPPLASQAKLFLPPVSIEQSENQATMALQAPKLMPANDLDTMAMDAPDFSGFPSNDPHDIQATTENEVIPKEVIEGKRYTVPPSESLTGISDSDVTFSRPVQKSLVPSAKRVALPKIRTSEDAGDWVPLLPRLGKKKKVEQASQTTPPPAPKQQANADSLNEKPAILTKVAEPEINQKPKLDIAQEPEVGKRDALSEMVEQHVFKAENKEEPSLNELISEAVDPITQMTEPDHQMMEKLAEIVESEDEDSTAVMDRKPGTITEGNMTQTEIDVDMRSDPSGISIDTRFPLRPNSLSVSLANRKINYDEVKEILTHLPFTIPKGYSNFTPIGHGTQASVFYAIDPKGESVALKCFDMQSFSSWKDEELLRREVSTLRELDCQGIPRFIDFIEDGRYAFLVESFIDAPSLEQRMENGFRPTLEQVLTIMHNAAWILKTLSMRVNPIIHRDIKPANILVDDDMNVTIVDFGVVAAARQHTIGMTFAGTAGYLAPEQLYGKVTPSADIFGLGMSIVHLVTNVPPCEMDMIGLKPDIDKYIPMFIPDHLCALLHDMIEPDPNQRIANANELLDRLAALDFNSHKLKWKGTGLRLSRKNRLASIERARKKRAKRLEKLALKVAGPKATVDPLLNIPEKAILHDNIHRRVDVYRSARTICLLQLATLLFVVAGLFFTDSILISIFDSWNSLFFSDLPVISTFSMIVSCIGLCIYSHFTNKGLFPLKENAIYVQRTRNDNRLLNDLYRYALTSEQSETVNYCLSDILAELYWDKSSDEIESLRNSENTLRELTKQAIMSNTQEIQVDKPVVELNLTNKDLKNTLKVIINEDEEPQFKEDDFCIACPPPKALSIPKLLMNTLPFILLTSFFVFIAVPLEISALDMDSPLPIIGYVFVNLLAMFLPYVIFIVYMTTRGQTSQEYRQNFMRFRKRFLVSCQQDRLLLEENNGVTLDSPAIKS